MKLFIQFFFCCFFLLNKLFAQQVNYLKVNMADCINCVSVLSEILKKDPKISIVIHDNYRLDSADLLEKFSLNTYASQIIWSGVLYDSLSRQFESELIQYCGGKEMNRSGLRKLNYVECKNFDSNTVCFKGLSNQVVFRDYKIFILLRNYLTDKQYVYHKKLKTIKQIKIDPAIVRDIYLNFLRDTIMLKEYERDINGGGLAHPKLLSVCTVDDSNLLAVISSKTYEIDQNHDTVVNQVLSVLKFDIYGKQQVVFVNNSLDKKFHYLWSKMFVFKGKLFFSVFLEIDSILKYQLNLENLIRFKYQGGMYILDKYMPTTLNDYLYKNEVNQNYNETYFDNGYSIMSLSNYILNLETEEKIYLPIADSVFKNIKIYPNYKGISYDVKDFKYNEKEKLFYIIYSNNNRYYYASFKPNAKAFKTNTYLYDYNGKFLEKTKTVVLSWDGKKLVYGMKNEDCIKVLPVSELQKIAHDYEESNSK